MSIPKVDEIYALQNHDLLSLAYSILRIYAPNKMTDEEVEELAVIEVERWKKYGDKNPLKGR